MRAPLFRGLKEDSGMIHSNMTTLLVTCNAMLYRKLCQVMLTRATEKFFMVPIVLNIANRNVWRPVSQHDGVRRQSRRGECTRIGEVWVWNGVLLLNLAWLQSDGFKLELEPTLKNFSTLCNLTTTYVVSWMLLYIGMTVRGVVRCFLIFRQCHRWHLSRSQLRHLPCQSVGAWQHQGIVVKSNWGFSQGWHSKEETPALV
jgi:hypothetical protein